MWKERIPGRADLTELMYLFYSFSLPPSLCLCLSFSFSSFLFSSFIVSSFFFFCFLRCYSDSCNLICKKKKLYTRVSGNRYRLYYCTLIYINKEIVNYFDICSLLQGIFFYIVDFMYGGRNEENIICILKRISYFGCVFSFKC